MNECLSSRPEVINMMLHLLYYLRSPKIFDYQTTQRYNCKGLKGFVFTKAETIWVRLFYCEVNTVDMYTPKGEITLQLISN